MEDRSRQMKIGLKYSAKMMTGMNLAMTLSHDARKKMLGIQRVTQ
jgi:hypothetical protein